MFPTCLVDAAKGQKHVQRQKDMQPGTSEVQVIKWDVLTMMRWRFQVYFDK